MEYVYGSMLLHKAGKAVTEEALGKTLQAAGIDVDEARVKATVAALKGVDIDKVISEATISAAPAASSAGTPEAPAAEGGEAPAEKKEETDEKKEEEAAEGLGALFG